MKKKRQRKRSPRPMGRPALPDDERRDVTVSFRITTPQAIVLRWLGERLGHPPNELAHRWVTAYIRDEAKNMRNWLTRHGRESDHE